MRRKSISIVALILGTVVGLVGGLLFAPSSGDSVRKVLSYRIKSYAEKLKELIRALSNTKVTVSSQAKVTGQEVIDETISKAEQLLQDIDELVAHLEQ